MKVGQWLPMAGMGKTEAKWRVTSMDIMVLFTKLKIFKNLLWTHQKSFELHVKDNSCGIWIIPQL